MIKWKKVLASQDLDYLIDLLRIPEKALINHNSRYTTTLYGTLLDIKSNLSIVQIQIVSKTEGTIPLSNIEGYYIDCDDMMNNQKIFVHVAGGGIKDNGQYVLYSMQNQTHWALHNMGGANQNHAWIRSNEGAQNHSNFTRMTWVYWNSSKKTMQHVALKIHAYNM